MCFQLWRRVSAVGLWERCAGSENSVPQGSPREKHNQRRSSPSALREVKSSEGSSVPQWSARGPRTLVRTRFASDCPALCTSPGWSSARTTTGRWRPSRRISSYRGEGVSEPGVSDSPNYPPSSFRAESCRKIDFSRTQLENYKPEGRASRARGL